MKTSSQYELAITASGLTKNELVERAKISLTALRGLTHGGNPTIATVKAVDEVLSEYVDWLEIGDTVTVPTVQPKKNA